MKIAVDGFEMAERFTGVGRLINNLLPPLSHKYPDISFYILTDKDTPAFQQENIHLVPLPQKKGYFLWQNGPFYKKLISLEPDVLIATNYTVPVFSRWKTILFEHDVSFAAHPEWFNRFDAAKRKKLVSRSLKKADTVVTVSEFSRTEILRYFRIDPFKVKVIYHGIEDRFKKLDQKEILSWKQRKGLQGKKVIGYLGSIFNRRHVPVLVEAMRLLRKEMSDLHLHAIGKDLTHPPQDIARVFQEDWILWEPSLAEDELPAFYSSLDGFVYLSEYEGFGLPPLEALACGTVPILLAKTALKEIYSELAVMIDEPDASRVQEAMKETLQNKETNRSIQERFTKERSRYSIQRFTEDFCQLLEPFIQDNA
jgi:glycosyltransferase involved in cell wall biosynthesis